MVRTEKKTSALFVFAAALLLAILTMTPSLQAHAAGANVSGGSNRDVYIAYSTVRWHSGSTPPAITNNVSSTSSGSLRMSLLNAAGTATHGNSVSWATNTSGWRSFGGGSWSDNFRIATRNVASYSNGNGWISWNGYLTY